MQNYNIQKIVCNCFWTALSNTITTIMTTVYSMSYLDMLLFNVILFKQYIC